MFRDREDAAIQLAQLLRMRQWKDPLVLGIPRGGVVIASVIARELNAELDLVLTRKLRAPHQPELAIGAIAEDGKVFLNDFADDMLELEADYLGNERRIQLAEIARRKDLYRGCRPPTTKTGRSVIVTDDGIATGSTMIAALQILRKEHPFELVVAVPVGSPDRVQDVSHWCDEIICVLQPRHFWAIGQFYQDFTQVENEQVVDLLKQSRQKQEEQLQSASTCDRSW